MQRAALDRVFRHEGKLWIVDYKTSRHEGADLDLFLDREQKRYSDQLRGYGEILDSFHQGLYFPLLRGWRQWNR